MAAAAQSILISHPLAVYSCFPTSDTEESCCETQQATWRKHHQLTIETDLHIGQFVLCFTKAQHISCPLQGGRGKSCCIFKGVPQAPQKVGLDGCWQVGLLPHCPWLKPAVFSCAPVSPGSVPFGPTLMDSFEAWEISTETKH